MPRLRPALFAAFALAALAGPASASSAPDAEAAALERARAWEGRFCPPPPSGLTSLGGFAAATLGALALARRRSA